MSVCRRGDSDPEISGGVRWQFGEDQTDDGSLLLLEGRRTRVLRRQRPHAHKNAADVPSHVSRDLHK